MKKSFKNIAASVLIIAIVASISIITGYLLFVKFEHLELQEMSSSINIVIVIFSTSFGSLALLKYWESVSKKQEENNWLKFNTLNSIFKDFKNENEKLISAFEWPHKFDKYLSLCSIAIEYDRRVFKLSKEVLIDEDSITSIKELDQYLETFENLYYSIDKGIMDYSDIKIFFHYYISVLGDFYYHPEKVNFKKYVSYYFDNIEKLLNGYENCYNGSFEYFKHYPRIRK